MPDFRYKALGEGSRIEEGVIPGRSRTEVYALLTARRLQPVLIELDAPDSPAGKTEEKSPGPVSATKLNAAQQLLFTREIVELLEAGLQLEGALGVMESREERSPLKSVAKSVRSRIREGQSFSRAVRESGAEFSPLYISVCHAGETAGALPRMLSSQADSMAFLQDLHRRLVSAMVYPCVVLVAAVALLIVFMTFLLPQLITLLGKTGQELPLVTRILVGTSDWLGSWWWTLLIGGALLIAGHRAWVATPDGRAAWDALVLKLPLFGDLLRKRFLAQFLQTLATLVTNGVVLLQAIGLVRGTFRNEVIGAALEGVSAEVSEGIPLSRSMKKRPIFPSALVDIIRIGEQTGDIGVALKRGADKYDREFNLVMQRFATLIQPLSILIVAIFVGIVAYAMITGIMTTVSGLRMR